MYSPTSCGFSEHLGVDLQKKKKNPRFIARIKENLTKLTHQHCPTLYRKQLEFHDDPRHFFQSQQMVSIFLVHLKHNFALNAEKLSTFFFCRKQCQFLTIVKF